MNSPVTDYLLPVIVLYVPYCGHYAHSATQLNQHAFELARSLTPMFRTIDIPGHERTLAPLYAIIEEYRRDCWTTGKHMPNPRLREAAIQKILRLSQFYSASDAAKILNRAAGKPFPPAKHKQRPRTS